MNRIKRFTQSELHGYPLYAKTAVAHSFETHWHEFYEITYYPDAVGETVINNTVYPISPGTLILMTPLDFHAMDITANDQTCYKIYFLDNQFEVELAKELSDPIILHDVYENDFMYAVLNELCKIQKSGKVEEYTTAKLQEYLLKSLVIQILQRSGGATVHSKNASSNLVKQGITYITAHFADDPTLSEVADVLGVSPNYFSKIFKTVTDTSFQAYVTNLRIKYAKQLLVDSDLSVSEIATHSGFNTLSNFLRTFKTVCGTTPSEYRTQHRH